MKMESQGGNSMLMRDYRKGNWTVQETMVLVEAKKMDEERRMKRHGVTSEGGGGGRTKPTELKWKCVEDYCWRKGCFRSQNQCNDKWDNLLRDFKKVRDYERRRNRLGGVDDDDQQKNGGTRDVQGDINSYWKLEKSERKEKGLPSNMLPEIYEALVGVVDRKGERTAADSGASNPNVPHLMERPAANVLPCLPPLMQHHPRSATGTTALQPPPPQQPPQPSSLPCSLPPLPTIDSDTTESSDSPVRRRRRRGEGSSWAAGGGSTASDESVIGSAIFKSASIITEAVKEGEEREDRRQREVMRLRERRLDVEETEAENTRRSVHGVVEAINKLSNSIFALASHKHNTAPK